MLAQLGTGSLPRKQGSVTHLLELKKWVLSYGPDCEVLEPEELRREVQDELRKALARYV